MNYKLLTVLLLASISSYLLYSFKPESVPEFEQWQKVHAKTYPSVFEQNYRRRIYLSNVAKILAHNADPTQTYSMAVNQFADLTAEEFAAKYLTLKVESPKNLKTARPAENAAPNGDVDWVAAGKVTGVKNQGQCGSCWAFSAVGAHESALLLNGRSALLSEQQLVDCSGNYGNMGCNGGWMDQAFAYARDRGLTTGDAYPYVGRDQACQTNGGEFRLSGFVDVPGCDNLANALNSRPVSVAVDASNWYLYGSGIFNNCGTAVNHGVLLVGASDSFWKIKNSWATSWGEAGFIRLAKGNTCAVCNYPSYPTL